MSSRTATFEWSRSGQDLAVKDLAFVVRAAGERTADAAVHALKSQLGPRERAAVTLVQERPFAQAVRRTLEIGAASGREWTVGMDADVLLAGDGVRKLLEMCRGAREDTFTVTGLMLCKFYGGFVFRGVHCYRSELLERACELLGEPTVGGPDPALKPESAVVHAMAARGLGYEGRTVVLAAHDFEQSYRHIYLKMRLRGRREVEGGDPDSLVEYCRQQARTGDDDHRVALWGAEDGIADAEGGRAGEHCDWFAAWPEFDRRMTKAQLVEKGPFAAERGIGYADRVIAAHRLDNDTRTPEWIRRELTGKAAA